MLSTAISVFRNARSTDPVPSTLGAFLQTRKYVPLIQSVRAITDKKQRDELKKDLPAGTISGTFRKREITGIDQYNGLLCLDFDGKDNPDFTPAQMRYQLSELSETLYAGLSVSGTGVFGIIPTDNDDPQRHAEVVDLLGGLILHHIGLRYDRACKDVCRLRFVSFDDEAYLDQECTVFGAKKALAAIDIERISRPPRPLKIREYSNSNPSDTTRKKVEEYLQAIEGSCVDITQNYDEWLKLGFALANEFGNDGEDYFQRISQFNPKYDQAVTEKKFRNMLSTHSGRVKIGSFFSICNNQGIRL